MFWDSFRMTGIAVAQIFILGAIGYVTIKIKLVSNEGLNSLSRLTIDVLLPIFIFCQLIKEFDFATFSNWWVFPLLSIAITVAGLLIGSLFSFLIKHADARRQFVASITFQNSGYLPLVLIASILSPEEMGGMFIYLFLFLAGFNMVMFSLGVHMISFRKNKRFELASLFSPPVIAVIVSLLVVIFELNKFVPASVVKPLRLAGDCTLPLAMFVVGGNLAQISLRAIKFKPILLMSFVKLLILPSLGLIFLMKFRVPELLGLLLIMELAMPPATLLSVIVRHYNKEDILVSHGIFVSHILSLITIPVFLSLYYALVITK